MDKIKRFQEITEEMFNLYKAKNKDYGNSFSYLYTKHGGLTSLIRLEDKIMRFEQLIDNKAEVEDEKLIDTLRDLANYAIMTIIEEENKECIKGGII